VLGTNVAAERLSTSEVVLAYCLAHVERAFRHFKLSELEVRPIFHYRDSRVRAHLLLCMLAVRSKQPRRLNGHVCGRRIASNLRASAIEQRILTRSTLPLA
jgi:hypothetical protein